MIKVGRNIEKKMYCNNFKPNESFLNSLPYTRKCFFQLCENLAIKLLSVEESSPTEDTSIVKGNQEENCVNFDEKCVPLSLLLSPKSQKEIESEYSGYHIHQNNGQRIFGPLSTEAVSPPQRNSEVFIGNLPKEARIDELVCLFAITGRIHTLRLMVDYEGDNRGYCFVRYRFEVDAHRAISIFEGYSIRINSRLTCHLSVNNCRLFMGSVPRTKTKEAFKDELVQVLDGVVDIIMYGESVETCNGQAIYNRGFAFVEFESNAAAAVARRNLISGSVSLWGDLEAVHVDWADPEPVVDADVLKQVCIIYLRNVPAKCSATLLREALFKEIGANTMTRVYKKHNYAFVHFKTRIFAEQAFNILNKEQSFAAKNDLEVQWARPQSYSKQARSTQDPANFCLSVPPVQRKRVIKARLENRIQSRNKIEGSSSSESTPSERSSSSCEADYELVNKILEDIIIN